MLKAGRRFDVLFEKAAVPRPPTPIVAAVVVGDNTSGGAVRVLLIGLRGNK